jgi:hypothetical protein
MMRYCHKCEVDVETRSERGMGMFGGTTAELCVRCGEVLCGVFDNPLYDSDGNVFMTGWCSTIDLPASKIPVNAAPSLWQWLMGALRRKRVSA